MFMLLNFTVDAPLPHFICPLLLYVLSLFHRIPGLTILNNYLGGALWIMRSRKTATAAAAKRHSKDAIQAAELLEAVLRGAIGDGVDVQARSCGARRSCLPADARLTRYCAIRCNSQLVSLQIHISSLAPNGVVRTFSGLLPQRLVLDHSGVISGTPIVVLPERLKHYSASPVDSSTYDFVVCVTDPRAYLEMSDGIY